MASSNTSFPDSGRRLAAAAMCALLAACGGDSTGPNGNGGTPTVATVEIAGAANSIATGEQLQLTATARDGAGNIVVGKTFTWTSTNQAVATVNAQGLVIAQTAGSATINATTDGRSGSFPVTVTAPVLPVLSSITPSPLVPGQPATLTGQNFSITPASNLVTIAGINSTVTAASLTSLTVNVPSTLCVAGSADVRVTVAGRASNTIPQPAQQRGTNVNLAVGQQLLLQSPADPCFQFAAAAANESYLVGVQSVSESVTSVISANVAMTVAGSTGPTFASSALPLGSLLGDLAPIGFPRIDRDRIERLRRHRQDELAFRSRERLEIEPLLRRLAASRLDAVADAAAAIPANLAVGDTLRIRVPNRDATGPNALCMNFTEITTVVRALGTRSIWLEDVANPAGGFSLSDYQTLVSQFDTTIYPTDTDYFGLPSDVDGNGRIAIVITKEINKFNILGFATTADLLPRSSCASSDFGEIYYSRAVDPNGMFGQAYTLSAALVDAPQIIAHEFTHLIQFGLRVAAGTNTFQRIWELEGQATLAEEVVGHAFTNRSTGRNYGFPIAFNCANPPQCNSTTDPNDWYVGGFVDLVLYYGFNTNCAQNDSACRNAPLAGAPEQCSWLDLSTAGNSGPCHFQNREVYGVPWTLIRYISDRYGPQITGGEKALNKRMVQGNLAGFANVANAVGAPMPTILAGWAASLYVDDRVAGADPALTLPSWNLLDIESFLVGGARLQPKARDFASAFNSPVDIRGGSTAYFRISGGGRSAAAVRVRGVNEALPSATLQFWIVRLQ